jgi:hypothetical protein
MIFMKVKGNPLLNFLAAVAGVDPTMAAAASDDAAPESKNDPRSGVVSKGPLAGRKRAPATPTGATARRARAR